MRRNSQCNMILLLLCICLGAGCEERNFQTHDASPGQPVRGGTLEILTSSDFDHLSTTSAYLTTTMGLLRALSRTLVTYPASDDFKAVVRIQPDVAIEVPSRQNGGISADGLTYTFHLRRGIRWNSSPPREVTAHDFIRAFKLFGNPVSPVGAPGYYTSTIQGFSTYCSRFTNVSGTVPEIRDFVSHNEIEGIRAIGDHTLVFYLRSPTSDFLNLLAMPFASPVPIEYLDYLPDCPEFRQHTLSIGPYRISHYIQNREMVLDRNPVWDPATDPLRPAYVDRIHYRFGFDPQLQQLQVAAGTADMTDGPIPAAELSSWMTDKRSNVWLTPPGDTFLGFFYLAINLVGSKSHATTAKLPLRCAIALGVDKAGCVQVFGGASVAHVLRQAVPSCASGYQSGADRFATPRDRGNPAKARSLLAAAGYPNGISLRMAYPIGMSLVAQVLQASLGRAGITVDLVPIPLGDFYGQFLTNPEHALRGDWDLALSAWNPDWFGNNNGRSVIQPLFDGRSFGKITINYGGYENPKVDALIDGATTARTSEAAESSWSEAAQRIMEDVAIVPLFEYKFPFAESKRLRNYTWPAVGVNCDITSVWLADPAPIKRRFQ